MYRAAAKPTADAEVLLPAVVATLGEGVVVQSLAAGIVSWNPAAETLLGLTGDQLAGRDSLDARWQAVHEDGSDWPGDTHPAMVTLTTGAAVTGAVMGVHRPDGSRVWLSVTSRLLAGTADSPVAVVAFADVTQQRQTAERLARSEASFRLLAESSHDAVTRHLFPDGRIVWASPSALALFGFEPAELEGERISELLCHPADRAALSLAVAEARATGGLNMTFRVVRKDGGLRWVEARGTAIRDPATGAAELVCTTRDVTDRVEAERSLAEASALHQAMIDSLPSTTLSVLDADLVYRVSDGAPIAGGIGTPAVIGRALADVTGAAIAERVAPLLRRALAGERVAWDQPGRYGAHYAVQAAPLGRSGDRLLLVAQDITDRHAAEADLVAREDLVTTSIEALDAGFLRFAAVRDRSTGEIEDFELVLFNAAAHHLLSPRGIAVATGARLRSMPWSDDGQTHFELYRQVVERSSPTGLVVELADRDGTVVDISAVPAGDGVVIICRDITPLRDAERRRREAELQFQVAFDGAPIGMLLAEPDGRILRANQALHAMLGQPDGALAGVSIASFTHPDDLTSTATAMRDLGTGAAEVITIEERYLRADGSTVWVGVHSTAVRERDGRLRYFIAHVQDITQRRHDEEQLRALADRDPLTGLRNRRSFRPAVADALAAQPGADGGSLLVIDLDEFKAINDTLGHETGDRVLVATADVLSGAVRSTDVVARLGGDEFAVFLPGAEAPVAQRVATTILARLAAVAGAGGAPVTASIGIATTVRLEGIDGLLRDADSAMYVAKRHGRNRAELWAPPA